MDKPKEPPTVQEIWDSVEEKCNKCDNESCDFVTMSEICFSDRATTFKASDMQLKKPELMTLQEAMAPDKMQPGDIFKTNTDYSDLIMTESGAIRKAGKVNNAAFIRLSRHTLSIEGEIIPAEPKPLSINETRDKFKKRLGGMLGDTLKNQPKVFEAMFNMFNFVEDEPVEPRVLIAGEWMTDFIRNYPSMNNNNSVALHRIKAGLKQFEYQGKSKQWLNHKELREAAENLKNEYEAGQISDKYTHIITLIIDALKNLKPLKTR